MAPILTYVRSETDIFSEPPQDASVSSISRVTYHPTATISSQTAPIEFFIQGNDRQYLDLSKTRIKLKCKIVGSDGKDMATDADNLYAPINNIVSSAFDRCSVSFNETEVTPKHNLLPQEAMFNIWLNHGKDYLKSQAEAGGYYRMKDQSSHTDEGWKARQKLCDGSAVFTVTGRPHGSIFTQPNYLIPGIDVRISFSRASSAFCLEAYGAKKQNVQLIIQDAKLYIHKCTLYPSIHLAHLKTWKNNPCVYSGKQVVMKSYTLPTGTYEHVNENILNGLVPDRVIIGLTGASNTQGTYDTNPFNFTKNNLSKIILRNNSEVPTEHVIDVEDDADRMAEGFISLFEALGISNSDNGLDMNMTEYAKGKALYGFDLRSLNEGFSIPQHGNVSIYLKFKTALTSPISVIIYPEYPSTLYINSDKQVYFKDYAREYRK